MNKSKKEIKKRMSIHKASTSASPSFFIHVNYQREIKINQKNKAIITSQIIKEIINAIKNVFKEEPKDFFSLTNERRK